MHGREIQAKVAPRGQPGPGTSRPAPARACAPGVCGRARASFRSLPIAVFVERNMIKITLAEVINSVTASDSIPFVFGGDNENWNSQ